MNDAHADITEDLLLLYELSLAVGQTLDPQANGRDFLRVLVAKRNLNGAAIWWLDDEVPALPANALRLLAAIPRSHVRVQQLSLAHPFWRRSRHEQMPCFAPDDPEIAAIFSEEDHLGMTCALIPLGDQGVLVLSSTSPAALHPRKLSQLRGVAGKLANAIQGAKAFSRLQQSEARLRETSLRLVEAQQASVSYARQLEQAHSQLQTLLHTLPDMIWLKDPEGVFLGCNRRFERLLGVSESDIMGKTDYDLVDHELADSFRESDRIAIARGTASISEEWVTFPGDSGRLLLETTKTPMYDAHHHLIGVLGVGHDITERKRVEQRLSMAIEVSQLVFWELDVPSGRLRFDEGLLPRLGLEPDSVLTRLDGWIDRVHPDDRDELIGRMHLALRPGDTLFDFEYRICNRSGRYCWLHSRARVLARDRNGQPSLVVGTSTNVTARKQVESEIIAGRNRLQATLAALPDLLFELDVHGRIYDYHSPRVDLLTRLPEALPGHLLSEILPASAAEVFLAALAEAHAGGHSTGRQYLLPQPQGDCWFELSIMRRTRSVGDEERFTALARDISERKRGEEALRLSEERSRSLAAMLRLLCDNVPDMIWAKDLDKRYLFANKALCEQLLQAVDTNEPLGRTDLFFALRERDSHPDDVLWHTFGELCQDSDTVTLLVDKPATFEEFGNVRGKFLFLDVHKAPFRNEKGEVIGTVGSARDITERKQLETELAQHREQLERLVEERTAALLATEARASHILQSSADGLYGVDEQGLITFINPAACTLLGYRAEEVIGRSAHALFHHSKLDGSPCLIDDCLNYTAIKNARPVRVDDEVYWHADGHPVPVMYAVHPMSKGGDNSGAVVSFVDMSEQRAAAQAREKALIVAENLARMRSEFLANMSHEIRTPMNGVLGFAQIGARAYKDTEKARNAFEKILVSGQRLMAIIDEILDFSKIEAGKLSIEDSEVHIVEIVDHALDLVSDRARAKHLRLQVRVASDLPSAVLGDPLRIGQVLLNLLSNAVKFTDLGSISVTAERRNDALVFRVRDTGIGMNEQQLEHLFNPFQQADGSITRRFGGTGLGLAISKRLAELMNGDIRVSSEPGAGSTFTFSLPLRQPLAPTPQPHSERIERAIARGKPLAGMSILIAEDDAVNRMVLEDTLVEAGAEVLVVGNGLEAIDGLLRHGSESFDIVLMDVQMPEMDGYEATRKILQLAPGLPVVGQTAHAFEEDRQKCLAVGMVEHIAKPIDPEILLALVKRIALRRDSA